MKRFIFSCHLALATGLLLVGCGDTCDCLKGETAEPAVIRVENRTSLPVYLPTDCQADPQVYIDDDTKWKIWDSVLSSWSRYSCDDILANRCRNYECLADGGRIEIGPGGAYEQPWSGHLLTDEPIDVPVGCRAECTNPDDIEVQCHRRVAAAPGEYTVKLWYWHPADADFRDFYTTFTWPATTVTVAIAVP